MRNQQETSLENQVTHGPHGSINLSSQVFTQPLPHPFETIVNQTSIRKHQHDLSLGRFKPAVSNSIYGLSLITFDRSVSLFFNRSLAGSIAIAEWATKSEDVDRSDALHYLSIAISQHCSCWEYLFQHAVYLLGFNEQTMPTRVVLDDIIRGAKYDIEFVEGPSGSLHEQRHPLARAVALCRVRQQRKRLTSLAVGERADQFFRAAAREFDTKSSWVSELRHLLRDHPVKEIHRMRNEISHNRPLGSQTFIGGTGALPGSAISLVGGRKEDPEDILRVLLQAQDRLRKALILMRQAIIAHDVPNTKNDAGVSFGIVEVVCPKCDRRSILPDLQESEDEEIYAFCRNCTKIESPLSVKRRHPVSQAVFSDVLHEVVREISTYGPLR